MFSATDFEYEGNIKSNLARIIKNVENNDIDIEEDKIFRYTDLLRATIRVGSP